jgi:hypothetical protein
VDHSLSRSAFFGDHPIRLWFLKRWQRLPLSFLVDILTLLLVKEWRIIFPALALQYVGVSLLVGISWPVGMALVKWITGWIVGILLVMGVISLPVPLRKEYETSAIRFSLTNLPDLFFENIHTIAAALFRFFAAALAIMTCLSISPQLADWFRAQLRSRSPAQLF